MSHIQLEFMGPVGTAFCTVAVPLVLYALTAASNSAGCLSLVPFQLPGWPAGAVIFSWQGVMLVYLWVALHLALHVLLPARHRFGVKEPDGQRWRYRLNGVFTGQVWHMTGELMLRTCRLLFDETLLIVYLSSAYLAFFTPWLPLAWAADHFVELLSGALVLSISLSITLYVSSFRKGAGLAASGTSGYAAYDFWMGRELNPRLFGVDLKEFCELYPGLIGWAVLNLSFAHKQFISTGQVSLAMVLINAFQLLYIIDALAMEPAILTTMDITSEGFGYMLAVGDLAWVPFSYCTQAKFIAELAAPLPWPQAAAIAALNAAGYAIFRGANGQKDTFRKDPEHPSVRHLETLQTRRGTRLLCSGWWGVARHINYTGDWLMGLAWCLACGHGCAVPYFYAAYFAALLIHRERRDDHACAAKYGADWDAYRRRVPWRLVPRVY